MASKQAIGIFDSGVGGLTVLKEIAAHLPDEDLVYLGDTARVPYGTKSPETVRRYALEAAGFLAAQGVKMLVVACNTASAVALDLLREKYAMPVIGVIEPGSRRAAELTRSGKVGVVGTDGTIKSGAYSRAIHAIDSSIEVHPVACPLFVPLAEEGWAEHEIARLAAEEYLAPLRPMIDTLVLGCTHYPLLKNILHDVLGPDIGLVDSAEETARAVSGLLGDARNSQSGKREIRFFVTDVPTRFERVGNAFFGHPLGEVTQVSLAD